MTERAKQVKWTQEESKIKGNKDKHEQNSEEGINMERMNGRVKEDGGKLGKGEKRKDYTKAFVKYNWMGIKGGCG